MSDNPAGWKPDPRGRHEYRYWDGTQWTDHVSDQGEVSQDPVADTAPPTDVDKSSIFTPSGVHQAPPTGESTPPPTASETPAAVEPAATEPAAAEPVTPDPVTAEPATTPEPVASEPAPTEATSAASAGPPTSSATPAAGTAPTTPEGTTAVPSTAQTDAKAAAQQVLHSKSPELATILSAVVPGSGHLYLGTDKMPLAIGLLVATLAALVLSWMSFLLFIVGFVLWLGAAAFALTDLRGGVSGLGDTALPKNVIAILLIGAGALLLISLFLPYYHVSYEVSGFGVSQSGGGNVSAFDAFELIDIILLVVGIASILAGAAALGLGPVSSGELPRWLPTAVAVGGAIAAVLILFRMFVDGAPDIASFSGNGVEADADIGRGFGIWFGLWAALVLVIANAGVLRSLGSDKR